MSSNLAAQIARERQRLKWAPPPVKSEIAGKVWYDYANLHRILGKTAFSLWVCLLRYRNEEGIAHVRRDYLNRVKMLERNRGSKNLPDRYLTLRQVRRAMSRLYASGLVEGDWVEEIRLRVVFGDYRHGEIHIPVAVEMKLRQLPLKGGVRRKGGSVMTGPITKSSTSYVSPKARKGKRISTKTGRVSDQKGSVPNPEKKENLFSLLSEKKKESVPLQKAEAPFSLSSKESEGGGDPGRFKTNPFNIKPAPFEPWSPPLGGVKDADGQNVLPPYPSVNYIKAATTPPPPCIKADTSDDDRVRILVQAFRGGTESVTGKPCFTYCKGVNDPKLRAKLLKGAAELLARGITPAHWVLFSFNAWSVIEQKVPQRSKSKGPPISWIFSAKRINAHAGWFGRESGSYSSVRLFYGDLHRDLMTRYSTMQQRINRSGGARCPNERIVEIVKELYPDGWRPLYEAARAEARETRAALDNLKRRGQWIW